MIIVFHISHVQHCLVFSILRFLSFSYIYTSSCNYPTFTIISQLVTKAQTFPFITQQTNIAQVIWFSAPICFLCSFRQIEKQNNVSCLLKVLRKSKFAQYITWEFNPFPELCIVNVQLGSDVKYAITHSPANIPACSHNAFISPQLSLCKHHQTR